MDAKNEVRNEARNMVRGRHVLGMAIYYNALCEVSTYAHFRDCKGLTEEECEMLYELSYRAANAIAIDFAEKFIKENE